MELPALDLRSALVEASNRVAEALNCDKVDAFLLDEAHQTLRAVGTSNTPMGRRQQALGLDVLALANGGRTVEVFKTGTSYLEHHADRDPGEVRGLVEELGVRSTLSVPFEVNGVRRGVLAAASPKPEFFQVSDLKFMEIVARWVGILAHRAELAELARRVDNEQVRRRAADELITVVAHDLRNHLHPLLARLQIMRILIERGSAVSIADLDKAIRSVQRLSHLTAELLDLKRLDEGLFSLNLVPVDLVATANETAASLGAGAVPVRVSGVQRLVAVADADRVRQALENMVANAIKYSPPGKAVEVRVIADDSGDKAAAILEVLDEGPGIAPEMVSTLFDRFASSADSKGIGLGLHLAYRIARIHHGDLSVHARPGGGTRFCLTLPLDPSEVDSSRTDPPRKWPAQ
jgi:two-component system OmpR family sensor kinase